MDLPIIDGRECVPVRLLPFMTNSRPLSSDRVAQLFSRREKYTPWSISAFNLRPDGSHNMLLPGQWNRFDDDLTSLAQDLQRRPGFEFQWEREWRRLSVERLPASVFVWRDELEAEYARSFDLWAYPTVRPGAREWSEEEEAAECEELSSDNAEVAAAAEKRAMEEVARNIVYHLGDGRLNFTPLLSADEEKVAFEGFEFVLPTSQRVAQPDVSEQHEKSMVTVSAAAGAEPTKLQPVDKGMLLKRAALIAKHEPDWPTIKSDLHSASENGLSKAAKAPAHGEWFEEAARAWAEKKGKLKASNQQVALGSSIFPRQVHRIEP